MFQYLFWLSYSTPYLYVDLLFLILAGRNSFWIDYMRYLNPKTMLHKVHDWHKIQRIPGMLIVAILILGHDRAPWHSSQHNDPLVVIRN